MDIDAARLLAGLSELSLIGARPDGGIDRVGWTEADMAAKQWLRRRLERSGIGSSVDAAFNVFGRATPARRRRLLIGSHTDSVSGGGRLDGAYGVVAALEVLTTLVEAGDPAADAVELVDFADEEGVRFRCGYLGSKALLGMLDPGALRGQVDHSGAGVEQLLEAAGVRIEDLPTAAEHMRDVAGFLELHIEQGPRLASAGFSVGVVAGILGVDRYRVRISGRSTHGGTTPFELRADASVAAAQLISEIPRLVAAVDPAGVATVGVISSTGGAINFTPREVGLSLEVRQPTSPLLAATASSVKARLAEISGDRGCAAAMVPQDIHPEVKDGIPLAVEPAYISPAEFDPRMVDACARACAELGVRHLRMHAGTWHDAGLMSSRVPTGMLLVPSIGGITHEPAENTRPEDLVAGARALLGATRLAVEALRLA